MGPNIIYNKPGMGGVKDFLESSTTHGNRGLVRLFWIFVLISLYVVFFGIKSFERFNEESIVVIKKNLDISSTDMNVRPGEELLSNTEGDREKHM